MNFESHNVQLWTQGQGILNNQFTFAKDFFSRIGKF